MSKKIAIYRTGTKTGAIKAARPSGMKASAHSTKVIPNDGIVVRVTEAEFLRHMVVDGARFEASRKLTG